MQNKKICPYCGEEIALEAKKCRFCGEWLEEEEAVLVPEPVVVENATDVAEVVETLQQHTLQQQALQQQVLQPLATQQPVLQQPQVAQPQQPVAPQVINIQLAQETRVDNTMQQEVNQNVEVTKKSSGSGLLWFEIAAVAGAIWYGAGHWWAGVIAFIVLCIMTQIPVIGTLLCCLLGAGVGLFAGGFSAGLGAPTWACWVIGIVVGLGVIAYNLEDKDSDD